MASCVASTTGNTTVASTVFLGRGARGGTGGASMVYADDGSVASAVDEAMADRVASAWAGLPLSAAQKESMQEVDQWTLEGQLRTLRPLYKYSFRDGQVIGIVAGLVNPTDQAVFIGIGFAVPINVAGTAAGLPPF